VWGDYIVFAAKHCSTAQRKKNRYCKFIDEFRKRLPTVAQLEEQNFHTDLAGTVREEWNTRV